MSFDWSKFLGIGGAPSPAPVPVGLSVIPTAGALPLAPGPAPAPVAKTSVVASGGSSAGAVTAVVSKSILPIPEGRSQSNQQRVNEGGFEVEILEANKAVQFQDYPVPPGATVWLRCPNANTADDVVRVALSKSAAEGGPNDELSPGDEMPFPVDNLGRIFVAGANVGDKLRASIKRG